MSTSATQPKNRNSRVLLSGILSLALMCSTGCLTLNVQRDKQPPVGPTAAQQQNHTYKVILSNGRKPKIFTGQLDKPVTVQQALVESGATREFRNMRVDIARMIPKTGQVLKMPVNFDSSAGSVMEETNYAIHPGDEILVRKPKDGSFLGSLTGG